MRSTLVRSTALAPVVVAVLIGGLLAGCRTAPEDPVPLSSPTVAPVSGPVAFHVRLGAGQSLTARSPRPDNCPGLAADVDLGSHAEVTMVAYATGCTVGSDNGAPGNGRHGVYRTSADIPAERRSSAQTVHTALGDALAFTQPYYECTNSCKNYTEPVAVLTLAQPADPALPTLTVYSAKGTIDLDTLLTFLRDQLLA